MEASLQSGTHRFCNTTEMFFNYRGLNTCPVGCSLVNVLKMSACMILIGLFDGQVTVECLDWLSNVTI